MTWGDANPAKSGHFVLYAALGRANQVVRIDLNSELTYGTVKTLSVPGLEAPFAVASVDGMLYAASSQIAHHSALDGGGRPVLPFRIMRIGKYDDPG